MTSPASGETLDSPMFGTGKLLAVLAVITAAWFLVAERSYPSSIMDDAPVVNRVIHAAELWSK